MPDEDDDHPFDRARAAIRASREARGLDPDGADDEPPLPSDPMERARVILERAARARESKGKKADAAEQRAREQLARLKGGGTPRADDPDDDDAPAPPPPGPKPRRL